MKRLLLILPLFFALASCGSGGSSSDSTDSSNATSVVAAKNSVSVSTSSSSEEEIFERVSVTINNVPEAGIHYGVAMEQENTSIIAIYFVQTTATTAGLDILFDSGRSLGEGIHLNKVALAMCLDEQCSTQIEGSPVIIDTSIEVTASTDSVSLSNNSISVEGNSAHGITPERSIVPVTVSGISPANLHIKVSDDPSTINSGSYAIHQKLGDKLDILVDFTNAQQISHGTHTSSYNISVCYDFACDHHLAGSPLALNIEYKISNLPEGVNMAVPDVRTELNHDVIDAEYSASLNAVAIASSAPSNAVYVYYLDDLSTTYEIPLDLAPTAISFSNAGASKNIAVGHDAKVTFIEFDESNPNASNKTVLNVPIDVYDLAATNEAVYAVPKYDQRAELYRIDVNDYSFTTHDGSTLYSSSKIKLHPDLNSVYLADNGLSPDDIEKISIETIPPVYVADSPYHGDHGMCGDLWMSNSGARIYTACGNTFRSSDVTSQDMIYTGQLLLISVNDYERFRLRSIAESVASNEVAAIEHEDEFLCQNTTEGCINVLSFFTKDFLGRVSGSAYDKFTVSGNSYPERPSFVFYNNDGTSAFVISQLIGIPTQKSYILEFNR